MRLPRALCWLIAGASAVLAPPGARVLQVENARIRLQFDGATHALSLTDKASGQVWHSAAPCFALRVPGEENPPHYQVACQARGQHLRIRVSGLNLGAAASLTLTAELRDDRVVFTASRVAGLPAGAPLEVEFPRELGRARAGESGYLVLPLSVGAICDFAPERPSRSDAHFYGSGQGWAMPLYGVVRAAYGERGPAFCAIAATPYDCRFATHLNRDPDGLYAVSPTWVYEGERLNYARRLEVIPLARASYVAVAKTYRRELQARGRFVSLRAKARGNPHARRLPGAVTDRQSACLGTQTGGLAGHLPAIQDLLAAAARKGFDRAVAYLLGSWNRWELGAMNPDYGTEADLHAAAAQARALSPGFVVSVYDNFLDLYPSAPGYDLRVVAKNRDGSPQRNWFLRERALWSNLVCARERVPKVRRELPKLARVLGKGSLYLDVEGALPLGECFDPAHPCTRADDARSRRELLRAARRIMGTLATEGVPGDYLADTVDIGYYFGAWYGEGRPHAVPVPLYALVYHDSVLAATMLGPGLGLYPLHVPLYGMLPSTFDAAGLRVSHEMRATAYAELVAHRFLTGPALHPERPYPNDVQWSRFSDGTVVVANFTDRPYDYDGVRVPAGDFVILNEDLALDAVPTGDAEPSARAGEPLTVTLALRNRGRTALALHSAALRPQGSLARQAKVTLLPPRLPALLKPGQTVRVTFRVEVAAAAGEGPLPLVARVAYQRDDRRREAVRLVPARIVPPAGCTLRVAPDGADRLLAVTLRGNEPRPLRGTIGVQPPAGWQVEPRSPITYALPPGGEVREQLRLTPPAGSEGKADSLAVVITYQREGATPLVSTTRVLIDHDLMAGANPGFEEGLKWWGVWGDWDTKNVTVDDTVARSGGRSARITSTARSNQYLAGTVGTAHRLIGALRFQVRSRVEGASASGADHTLFVMGLPASWTTRGPSLTEPGTPPEEWRELAVIYTPPAEDEPDPGVLTLAPHLIFRYGEGTAWFDDVRLVCDGMALPSEWRTEEP